jgi:hypothetical protein
VDSGESGRSGAGRRKRLLRKLQRRDLLFAERGADRDRDLARGIEHEAASALGYRPAAACSLFFPGELVDKQRVLAKAIVDVIQCVAGVAEAAPMGSVPTDEPFDFGDSAHSSSWSSIS